MQKIKKCLLTKHACLPARHGSILAYSLIILAMMIAIVTTISVATINEKKGASSTEFSVQAYQTADSGVQLAIKKINGNSSGDINTVFNGCTCTDGGGVRAQVVCSDAGLESSSPYTLSFFSDSAGTDAKKITLCTATVSNILSIKSVGTFHEAVRAVQVAVAASCGTGSRYLGVTTSTFDGSGVGGYGGGDAKCNTAISGSRMCSTSDFAYGQPTDDGWYSSFIFGWINGSTATIDDCKGWNSNDGSNGPSGHIGFIWKASSGSTFFGWCSEVHKILCCQKC